MSGHGVIDPKGSGVETHGMQTDPRPHIRRRRHAIGRLRSLSTTAAVAGLAGTAGFGAVAALTWSGDPNATPLPAANAEADPGTSGTNGTTVRPRTQVQPVTPNGGFAQPPAVTTPRTGRSGGSHVSTGGSH